MFSGLQFVSQRIYFGLAILVGKKNRKLASESVKQGITRSYQMSFVIVGNFFSTQDCIWRGRMDNTLAERHFKL